MPQIEAGRPRLYFSYLLRVWQERSQGRPVWRFSLEHPHTGERLGFTSLEGLLTFLEQRTKEQPDD